MERDIYKHSPLGARAKRRWDQFVFMLRLFDAFLALTKLHDRGMRNALDLRTTRFELTFDRLPKAFNGFRILHLSDIHFDSLPGLTARVLPMVAGEPVDLCVLTGDYLMNVGGPHGHVVPDLAALVDAVRSRHGLVAVLGNHDPADMVPSLESLGIRVLIDETITIEDGGEAIHVTGTDDVHYFHTERAGAALRDAPEGFRIALVHSPEIAGLAARAGFDLYLTGHTHGGQVCLPGGRALITHLVCHSNLARGLWRLGGMQGYTTTGVGVSGIPVRFNTRGEVVVLTLRRSRLPTP